MCEVLAAYSVYLLGVLQAFDNESRDLQLYNDIYLWGFLLGMQNQKYVIFKCVITKTQTGVVAL